MENVLGGIGAARAKLRPARTVVTNAVGERFEVRRGTSEQGRDELVKIEKVGDGFVVDETPDTELARVCSGLFIGAADAAWNEEGLHSYKITHVLSLVPSFLLASSQVKYHLQVDLLDVPEQPLRQVLVEQCAPFIDQARSTGGAVLVHCNAGISRSAAIVIGYLLLVTKGLTLKSALQQVQIARPVIKPNAGFLEQLEALERDLANGSVPFFPGHPTRP